VHYYCSHSQHNEATCKLQCKCACEIRCNASKCMSKVYTFSLLDFYDRSDWLEGEGGIGSGS